MGMLFRLAWRSIWRHRRRTLITLSSVVLGLTFALFFVSLGEGVYSKTINDVARMQAGHITLEHRDYRNVPAVDLLVHNAEKIRKQVSNIDGIERVKMLILGQGVARSSRGAVGVAVMGVEPSLEKATSPLAKRIIQGAYLEDTDRAVVLVGAKLARQLKLSLGKKLVLTAASASGEIIEEMCRVKGIFKTGSDEVDGYFIQGPASFIRKVYGIPPDAVTQIGVVLKNPRAKNRVIRQIRKLVTDPRVAVLPWERVVPELASYVRLDRTSNLIFQGLLLFLILFTVFNTILMSVLEREHEFAVLLAIGTPPRVLQAQVVIESMLIGFIGCSIGMLLGGAVAQLVSIYGLDLRMFTDSSISVSGYAISLILHPKLCAWMFVWLGGGLFAATILSSLAPIRRIPRIQIAQILR